MKRIYFSALLVAGLMATESFACEFHDGPYGMQWRPYDPSAMDTLLQSTDDSSDTQSKTVAEAKRKVRPVFSSSTARAVESAKARILKSYAESKVTEETTETN
ncbi:MAG: hypothetical protein MJA83_13860 [Gammaproteobacteria bacterium]|nr:hypothetical protein [Gammaproteobacteria bacterium]